MTVKQKQLILAYFDCMEPGQVDGIWGPQSASATRKLQRKLGITEDGDFGQNTAGEALSALVNGVELPEDVTDNNVGNNTGTFWDEIEFFDRSEFKCTCGGRGCNGYPAEPVERLVRNAESARKHFDRKAIVSSGVRCQLRNSELPGSASNSLHMRGKAMDFCIQGVSSATLLAYVKTLPEVDEAYAIDGSFVHMGVEKYT